MYPIAYIASMCTIKYCATYDGVCAIPPGVLFGDAPPLGMYGVLPRSTPSTSQSYLTVDGLGAG